MCARACVCSVCGGEKRTIAENRGITKVLALRNGSSVSASIGERSPPQPAANSEPCTAVCVMGSLDAFWYRFCPLTGRPYPSRKHAGEGGLHSDVISCFFSPATIPSASASKRSALAAGCPSHRDMSASRRCACATCALITVLTLLKTYSSRQHRVPSGNAALSLKMSGTSG